jgi:hypothetical protein
MTRSKGNGGPAGSRVRRYSKTGRAMRVETGGRQWSDEAETLFFDHLAASCNVTTSAAAAGFAHTTVYRYRLTRPEFAARWQAALCQGYARLELALLNAALETVGDVDVAASFDADRPIPKMSVDQAMDLLRRHHRIAGGVPVVGERARRRSLEEVRASILRKVEAIRIVDAAPADPAGPVGNVA